MKFILILLTALFIVGCEADRESEILRTEHEIKLRVMEIEYCRENGGKVKDMPGVYSNINYIHCEFEK